MFEEVRSDKGNEFYEVKETEIITAQNEVGIIFPENLVEFYKQVGYGFIKTQRDNFNRIMDPLSVCDFRLRRGQFADDPEIDMYEIYQKDKLIFFEICEGCYLSIGFSKNNNGAVFYGKNKVADNLTEFLSKYMENELYFD